MSTPTLKDWLGKEPKKKHESSNEDLCRDCNRYLVGFEKRQKLCAICMVDKAWFSKGHQ